MVLGVHDHKDGRLVILWLVWECYMMGTRQKLIYGDEVDQVFNLITTCYSKRQSSKIKKRMRRRARREATYVLNVVTQFSHRV